jgi:hypothetical protein
MGNWRTTLAGMAGAVALAWQPLVLTLDGGPPVDWERLKLAAVVGILGWLAKDAH